MTHEATMAIAELIVIRSSELRRNCRCSRSSNPRNTWIGIRVFCIRADMRALVWAPLTQVILGGPGQHRLVDDG